MAGLGMAANATLTRTRCGVHEFDGQESVSLRMIDSIDIHTVFFVLRHVHCRMNTFVYIYRGRLEGSRRTLRKTFAHAAPLTARHAAWPMLVAQPAIFMIPATATALATAAPLAPSATPSAAHPRPRRPAFSQRYRRRVHPPAAR